MGPMIPKELKYNLYYGKIRRDVLRSQNLDSVLEIDEPRSLSCNNNSGMGPVSVRFTYSM